MQSQHQQSTTSYLSEFYFTRFHRATQSVKRGLYFSGILIILYNLQVISLLLSPPLVSAVSTQSEQNMLGFFVDIVQASKLYPLFTDSANSAQNASTLMTILLICLAVDVVFLGSVAGQFAIFVFHQNQHRRIN